MAQDSQCLYCEDGEKRQSLMREIYKFETSTLYLFLDQKHLGRVVLKFNDHKTDPSELTPEENQKFFAELARVSKAIMALFRPGKINYAIYGDLVPHLHIHIVPKYPDALQWGRPFDDSAPKKTLSEAEYADLIGRFRRELDRG